MDRPRAMQPVVAICGALLATAALAAPAPVVIPSVTTLPIDESGTAAERNVPFLHWHEDLSAQGYVEKEVLISGVANVYDYADEAGQSPEPVASGVSDNYTTRVLVRHPIDPSDFNGVVFLEILNATAGYDGAPHWNLTYPAIMAEGAAWIGVTYGPGTANFMRDTWGTANFPAPSYAQPRNRSRYATLSIPSSNDSWDILNQAAALMRDFDNPDNPMQGLTVQAIVTVGYSQSAAYVTSYANSFYPSFEAACVAEFTRITLGNPDADIMDVCTPIVNGYILAAGGPSARRINDSFGRVSYPLGDPRNCENAYNRSAPCLESGEEADNTQTDRPLPKIMRYTTESDIKSVRVRQDFGTPSSLDQPFLRTYEVAGSSHVDFWGNQTGKLVAEYQFGPPDDPNAGIGAPCDLPMNPLRTGIPLSAVQSRMGRWIKDGTLPPPSHFIEFEGSFDDGTEAWVRDADGNVVGGVRPPRIEVPLGQYLGSNPYSGPLPSVDQIFCEGIVGGFDAFDATELESRYANKKKFVVLTWWNMWLSYLDGFLLAVDAITLLDEAKAYEGIPD